LSRCPDARLATAAAILTSFLAAPAWPDASLGVSGRVVATEPRLAVSVTLTNRGDPCLGPIDVAGELDGQRRAARLAGGLARNAEGVLTLEFARAPERPGLHALTLLVEHPLAGTPDAAGNPPLASERAFLMLAIGASPGEAVRIEAEPLGIDVRGALAVRLESRDGEAVRVRLRALTPRGLRAEAEEVLVDVPARGPATVSVPIVRAGAPRGRRTALLLVAETPDGPLARTSVAAAAVEVENDPSRVAALRPLILTVGLGLLAAAVLYQLWTRSSASRQQQA
jgi:hypothetical protein